MLVYTKNGEGLKSFPITGRNIAHVRRDASQRAGIAAQLVLGEIELIKPTVVQTVAIAHISQPYINFALRLSAETRARLAAGELSLADAAKANGLLTAWLAATPTEQAALGAVVGVNKIWDAAIAPLI
jgi:hypothetical protein